MQNLENTAQQSHRSKFFAIGLNHRIHIQLCYYPDSTPPHGLFIFIEKEVGPSWGKYFESKNHMLHQIREKEPLEKIYTSFSQADAELYAKKLSPRLKM